MDSPTNLFNKPLLAPRPPLIAAQVAEAVLAKHGPRRNVSSACSACKTKRKKCDGNHPCSSCIRLGSRCHYYAAHDGRKDLKRKLATFEKDSQCLHQLLDLTKGDNDQRAAHLLTLIRKTSSVEEIEALVEEQLDIEAKDSATAKFHKEDGNDYVMSTSTSDSTAPSSISMQFAGSEQPLMEGEPHVPASSLPTDSVCPTPSLTLHGSGIAPLSSDVFSGRESSTSVAKTPAVQHRLSSNSKDLDSTSDSPPQQGNPRFSRSRPELGQGDSFRLNVPLRNHPNHLIQGSLTWHPALKCNAESFRHPSLSHLVPNAPLVTGTLRISGFPLTIEEQQLEILHKPEWSILPLAFDDGSTLCRACTSFLSAARAMIEQGTSISAIIGEDRPQVDFFFAPRRLGSPEEISVSHWACSLFSSFRDLERSIALIWVLLAYRLMRWMICPSAETYASLFVSQRPTLVQRTIPHSAVVDMVHLPDLRDAVCRTPRDFLSSANGTSVNWPKRLDQAVEIDPDNGSLYITKEFEQHGLNLGNWTYSADFLQTFPELEGKLRVKTP